jgi:WD40 repeat protein
MEPPNPPAQPVQPPWPVAKAEQVATLGGHTGGVAALAFTPDRCLLAVAPRNGPARLWNLAGPQPRERGNLGPGDTRFATLAFSPNSRLVACGSASPDGLTWLYDVTEKEPQSAGLLKGARGPVGAIAFSPDNKQAAGGGDDRSLRVWDVPSPKGDPRVQLLGHTGAIRALAFSPDGQGIATAALDGTVRVWALSRIRSWERVKLPHPGEVTTLAYAPDGKSLATAGKDGVIRLWDPTAFKPVPRVELKAAGPVHVVLMTADTLVSVGDGPRVTHWDVFGAKPLREWEVPGGPASAVAITVDGRYLAAGTAGGTVGVFRVAEKRA